MTEQVTAEELVKVDTRDLPAVRARAADTGVELIERPNRAIDPVTSVTLLIVGGAAAVRTVMTVVEELKGGQVIDLRPDAPQMLFRTKDLQYGMIAVRHSDGKVQIDLTRSALDVRGTIRSLVTVLSRSTPGGLDDVVNLVRGEVGDDVPLAPAAE